MGESLVNLRSSTMEGYLIRVPVEACFPDNRPAWRQRSDPSGPVHSRVLYYILEEGYLCGYESPDEVDEPVECFQLTSHRIEVNAMYSLNIFELKARAVAMQPQRQLVEETSSSDSSDSDSSSDDVTCQTMPRGATYTPQTSMSIPAKVVNGSFHVVFFAADKDLVKKWAVKLLNWNRYVFKTTGEQDPAGLKLAYDEIVEALRAINATNRFLRPIDVENFRANTISSECPQLPPSPVQLTNAVLDPIEHLRAQTTADVSSIPEQCATVGVPATICVDPSSIIKPSDPAKLAPSAWWMIPFATSRKISSHSLRR